MLVNSGIVLNPAALHLFQLLDQPDIKAFLVNDHAVTVGTGDAYATQLMNFLDGVDCYVAGAGNEAFLAVKGILTNFQRLIDEERGAIAGCLGPNQGAAELEPLAGQDTRLPAVGDPFVLAEHIANLAATHSDIARRNVGVLTDVAIEFGHEALAETHDFIIGLAFGIKIGPSLAAADRHAGQGVLEDLLEAEELDDTEVDRGVEAQAALVGTKCAVEFNAETAVDVNLPLVVLPGYPEDDLPFRFADALDDLALKVFRVFGDDRSQ